MERIDLQYSEDFKSKFLSCHIRNFCKYHVLLSGGFLKIISHNTQIVCLALYTAGNSCFWKWSVLRVCVPSVCNFVSEWYQVMNW